jgi:hypothetical protein
MSFLAATAYRDAPPKTSPVFHAVFGVQREAAVPAAAQPILIGPSVLLYMFAYHSADSSPEEVPGIQERS